MKTGNPLRARRTRYNFERIEGGEAFDELRRLSTIPSHKRLTLRAIHEALEDEINQVKDDISGIYRAIRNDIKLESGQMERVEHQLRKSMRKVDQIYDKIQTQRIENQDFKFNSRLVESFMSKVENMSSLCTEIDDTVDHIVTAFSQVDSRIPQKSRLFNGHLVNEQHYPLLFGLMRQKFGDQLATDVEESGLNDIELRASESETQSSSSSHTSLSNFEPTEVINDLIARHRASQAAKDSSAEASEAYLPPTLRKVSAPSTKITFETISAEQLFRGE